MKLHGNAALSLNKRKLLAGRVVEEGWSLIAGLPVARLPSAIRIARWRCAPSPSGFGIILTSQMLKRSTRLRIGDSTSRLRSSSWS
jgi:hypothetical protein